MGRNKEKDKISHRRWYLKNRDRVLAKSKEQYKLNPQKYIDKMTEWRIKNPGKSKELLRRRKRLIKQATPYWVNRKEIAKIYDLADHLQKMTGIEFHVHHAVPLNGITKDGYKVCGLHVHWNLEIVNATFNLQQGRKVFDERLNP